MSIGAAGGGSPAVLTTATDAVGAYGIAVNASTIFFAAQNNTGTATSVESMPLGGAGAPLVFAPGQLQALAVALDSTNVYWLDNDPNTGSLSSAPLPTASGPGPITVLASKLDTPLALAVDASGIYYTASGGGRVWRLTPP
jgi:hypothetical protein